MVHACGIIGVRKCSGCFDEGRRRSQWIMLLMICISHSTSFFILIILKDSDLWRRLV